MRHCVTGKVGVALHLHLLHDAGSITANGFYTDMKPIANFRQGDAGGNHFHDFVFSVREQLMQGLVDGLIQIGDQFLCQACTDVATAAQYLLRALVQIARASGLQ